MNRLAALLPSDVQSLATAPAEPPAPAFPPHVTAALSLLRAGFATNPDQWSKRDRRDYGRQFVRLSPEDSDALLDALRDRFVFRPTVAEVRTVAAEILGNPDAIDERPAYAALASRDAAELRAAEEERLQNAPLRIEGSGRESYGRAAFSAVVAKIKREVPEEERRAAYAFEVGKEERRKRLLLEDAKRLRAESRV